MQVLELAQTVPLTKHAIQEKAAEDIFDLVNSGEINPLNAYLFLKSLAEYVNAALNVLKPDAFNELDKYRKEGGYDFNGVKVEISQAPRRFDYSNDSRWSELQAEIDRLRKYQKEREAFLKKLQKPVVDPETGELIEPPKVKSGGYETIKVTFPEK